MDSAKDVDTWRTEKGEDASSTFYYFGYFIRGADNCYKVRMMWNGGFQNDPTTTDFYYISDTEYKVVVRSYDRKSLKKLLSGETPEAKTTKNRKLVLSSEAMNKQMLSDLQLLLYVSSMRQRPLPQ